MLAPVVAVGGVLKRVIGVVQLLMPLWLSRAPMPPAPVPLIDRMLEKTRLVVLPVTESGMLSTASSRVPPELTLLAFAMLPSALESSTSRMPALMVVEPE